MSAVAPDRSALSGLVSGVAFLSGVAGGLGLSDAPYPRPGSDLATVRRYFQDNARSARISAAGQLVCAVTLARFTASVVSLAGRTQAGTRLVQAVAATGGAVAATSLAASAAYTAALSGPAGRDDERTRTMHRRAFLAGGIVHGFGFGLLVGALGVVGRRTGALPAPLARTALASGAASVASPLYLVAPSSAVLIPAGRFSGLVVDAIAAVLLARGRADGAAVAG
jgi:hypothetical protein